MPPGAVPQLSSNVEKCELCQNFRKYFLAEQYCIDIVDIETETAVYNKLAEPDILPQNILPFTTPIEINEIIKRLPNEKSPEHVLITNAILKKNPQKNNHIFVYFIQFINKNQSFSN